MWSALRRVLLGFATGLMLVGITADAQIRPDRKTSRKIKWETKHVSITVNTNDYKDLATGIAYVTVTNALRGTIKPKDPWIILVAADSHFRASNGLEFEKPCRDLAIRRAGRGPYRPLQPNNMLIDAGPGSKAVDLDLAFDLELTAYPTDGKGDYIIDLYFTEEHR